jgi:hypothetical protein
VRVLILYETRRGSTLTVARAIRDGIRDRGHAATTAPIRTVDVGTVAAADAIVVGTWTQGRFLKTGPGAGVLEGIADLPSLDGWPAAVFCTYRRSPRRTLDVLTSRLQRKGARVVVAHPFKRRKGLGQVPAYVDLVVGEFEALLGAHGASPAPTGA